MNTKHAELRQRLDQYSPDVPGASLPFSERLARENGWKVPYARRVVAEYKRFAFLAIAAGHPVTPSDQVDQAWHLHLIYTESYWTDFCQGILRQPLHHGPTKGGRAERSKFFDCYSATLDSYRKFFQEEPPADIWPDPSLRFNEDVHFARVNTKRNWVIPRPRLKDLAQRGHTLWNSCQARFALRISTFALRPSKKHGTLKIEERITGKSETAVSRGGPYPSTRPRAWQPVLFAGLIALLLVGCQLEATLVVAPFDLAGKDFLTFYCLAFTAVGTLAYLLRLKLREPDPATARTSAPPLDAYATAYLAGGVAKTADAVLVNLAHTHTIKLDSDGQTITVEKELAADAPALEQFAYQHLTRSPGSMSVSALRQSLAPAVLPIRRGLQEAGYLVTEQRRLRLLWWPALIALTVPALGIIRMIQGIMLDRPIGYLFGLVIISLLLVASLLVRRPHRTTRGDHTLAKLKDAYADLRRDPFALAESGMGASLPLAIGLFGLNVLAETSLAHLPRTLHPPRADGGGCGTSSAGGGGTSGDSGCGSSCGGGGCGGCGGS